MSKKTESQKNPVQKNNNDLVVPTHLVRHFIDEIVKKVENHLNISEPLDRKKRKTYFKDVGETIVNITLSEIPVKDKSGSTPLTPEDAKKKTAEGISRQLYNGHKDERLKLRDEDYKNRYFLLLDCEVDIGKFEEKYPLPQPTNLEELGEAKTKEESHIINVEDLTEDLTYYTGFYYSIREFRVKKFGFAIDENDIDQNKEIRLYEWGFHDKTDLNFLELKRGLIAQELGKDDPEPIENSKSPSINFDFEKSKKSTVSKIAFKGRGKFKDNKLFFGRLTDGKTFIQIMCAFKSLNFLQGTVQAVTIEGDPISVEVFLLKVKSKEEVYPLDMIDVYKDLKGYSATQEELKHIVLFLISKRNNYLISAKSTTPDSLSTGGVFLRDLRDKLVGTYRVWNFDTSNQIVQSRIVIDKEYRCFLFPYFEDIDTVDENKRVQCCVLNINSTFLGKVWMPSFVKLQASNIAIIDFINRDKKILKGVYGSVGKGGDVVGDYMVLIEDNRAFRVRKIGDIRQARIYAKKYGFPRFTEILIGFLKSRRSRFNDAQA